MCPQYNVCLMCWFLYYRSFILTKKFMNFEVTLQGWFDEAIVHHGLSVPASITPDALLSSACGTAAWSGPSREPHDWLGRGFPLTDPDTSSKSSEVHHYLCLPRFVCRTQGVFPLCQNFSSIRYLTFPIVIFPPDLEGSTDCHWLSTDTWAP